MNEIDEEAINKLKSMSIEYLESLRSVIDAIIEEKKREPKNEYEFEFNATNDPRKGVPFVARLVWENGKIDRKFYDLEKTYGKKEVTVFGKYKAKDGDIIEIRKGGSWRNDYRYWYIVQNGKLIFVADIDNAKDKSDVIRYLKGEITVDELLGSDEEDDKDKQKSEQDKEQQRESK
jgi:hypothetical protein